ncbi:MULTISPECIES: hypothetical protein [Virgibacillus]|uniref:Uncharacterized protein n=1 Tax=Virgibacillus dokdonensis TaxID=302167 RepID=A0A2K9J6B2_9BACI|nr:MULTISPECIES: hypothetical protein [Virgibacillus]AUJ24710.1 hypothetical protein A21D_01629 [Virgibacillus dokdonensis]NWO14158.1 hypothetical protein [Virgibacillus sp.]
MSRTFDRNREMLHKLIDDLPEDKLPKATDIFEKIIGEETVSDEDKKELDIARKEIANGESYSFDEVFGKLEKVMYDIIFSCGRFSKPLLSL